MILLLLFFIGFIFRLYLILSGITYFIILNLSCFNLIDFIYLMVFDWISVLFISLVILISRLVILYSYGYIGRDFNKYIFMYILLMFVVSILLMIVSLNLFRILLGWDGLGLVSYCLVIYYQSENRNRAGIITVLTNRIGDIGLIFRLLFLTNFYSWGIMEFNIIDKKILIVGIIIIVAAVTKRAQIPFSVWLPAAMAAPTPVSSLVHSSTLVTAGVYLIIRFNEFFVERVLREILLFMSVLTMFVSGLSALFEIDLKKIIAFSTLRQLGVIILILSLGIYDLAFFHLLSHAVFKAILFLRAGRVIHGIIGYQDIRILGIISLVSPFISYIMVLSRLSLRGVLFLRGFYSKDIILEYIYIYNINWTMLLLIFISTIFTVLYSLRLVYYSRLKNNILIFRFNWIEDYKYNIPIFILGIITIFWGNVFSWLFLPIPYFFYLSYQVKLINLFLIFIGIVLFFVFYVNLMFRNIFNYFFSSIWFLSFLRRRIVLKSINLAYNNYKFDQTWIEDIGRQGVLKEIIFFSGILSKVNIRRRIKYIFIFYIFLIMLLNIYSYSLIKNIALKKLRYNV